MTTDHLKKQLWHPNAKHVPIEEAPRWLHYTGGGHKVAWHTTEGSSVEGAVAAYHAAGVCPTFTISVRGGRRTLLQHLPINRAASALRHQSGTPATNTANVIQVEIVGFAEQSGRWPDATYYWLHHLARWCRIHFDVPLSTEVGWRRPTRLTGIEWVRASGHVGHMHCPGNDHADPGNGFRIGKVTDFPPGPPPSV